MEEKEIDKVTRVIQCELQYLDLFVLKKPNALNTNFFKPINKVEN